MINPANISTERLERAIGVRKKMDALAVELLRMLSPDKRRHTRSAEVRKKIGDGIRASWAKRKGLDA